MSADEQPVVAGTRRSFKELVDGTLRVQVDIDPMNKARFLELFPEIDAPIAMAPLVLDFERKREQTAPTDRARPLGPLAHSAVLLCKEPAFQQFAADSNAGALPSEESAASYVREWCGVSSRKELDSSAEARQRFARLMVRYREWQRD